MEEKIKPTPRPCRKSGCPFTTHASHGYCDTHQDLASWGKRQKLFGNRHKRGYGNQWEKIRERALQRDGYLCVMCKKENRFISATHVDHIKSKQSGGGDELENLQSLCAPHHEHKTASE